MLNKKDLWMKNGDINEQAIIPDINILPPLSVDNFDCDSDLEPYSETLLCDDEDPICVMSVKDDLGNQVSLKLKVCGDVRIGWKEECSDSEKDIEDEEYDEDGFEYYKHYSQFPNELLEAIKSGDYYENPRVNVDESNWVGLLYTSYNKEGEEIYCDDIDFEPDISKMTQDELKALLLDYAKYQFEEHYQNGDFIKPDITLQNVLEYANLQFSASQKGDDVSLKDFPLKGVDACFSRSFENENEFKIRLYRQEDNSVLMTKSDGVYNCLYDYIMEIACGELECDNGKTIKENLNAKTKSKQDIEKM